MRKTVLIIVTIVLIATGQVWATSSTEAVILEEYVPKVIIKGKWGTELGEFGLGQAFGPEGDNIYPKEFTLDNDGNIYIVDSYNNRIQKFDLTGKYLEMYPLEIFVLPTDEEFGKSVETWNKNARYFVKVFASGLAWINGQLYISQKIMPDAHIKKYDEKVLVLKSGKFVDTTDKELKFYKNANLYNITDNRENHYVKNKSVWEKHNKNGKKIFEFETSRISGKGKGWWHSRSAVCFGREGNIFYEMKVFAVDDNRIPFQPDKGGMQIIKWSLKK